MVGKHLFIAILLGIILSSNTYKKESPSLAGMTVELAETPLGVDTPAPRFGWQLTTTSKERGIYQTAYQLTVQDEAGKRVWDSGKVAGDISQHVVYQGEALQPTTRYTWQVKVWNNQGKVQEGTSWFETSLLTDHEANGWHGARWIGGGDEDMVLYSPYLPVFRLDFSFQMKEQAVSRKIAFVYGANDERLMDANKNLYHLANGKDASYIKVEFDLTPLKGGGNAWIHLYRAGYQPDDKPSVPLKSFLIPNDVLNAGNQYQAHTFSLYSNLGFTTLKKGDVQLGEVNVNPLGQGGDFIAFPVVGEVGFALEDVKAFSGVKTDIRNFRSPENRLTSVTLDASRLKGGRKWYVQDPSRNSMPMLRTEFATVANKIRKARLYVTSRGIYEMYLNGQRVGKDYFNPGVTQYNKTHLYQVYDVTQLVQAGKNALGAVLAEGWWSGGATYAGENWNFFGDRQSLLAQLVVTYEDGQQQTVVTSPDTWKYFNQGPVVYGSFFQGEVYDARKEQAIAGWSCPGYEDAAWKPAVEVTLENHVSQVGGGNVPKVNDYSAFHLKAQYGQTVRAIQQLTARSVEEVRPGIFVYDMGQNMVGVPEITLHGMEAGREINLRYAEVKYPDLPRYAGNEGMIMLENIRAAMAQDKYITKGGEETIAPRFTYHGYRYVEITGIDKALPLESVKGTVLSSIDRLASQYETSNEKVNQLWHNIVWSTYANFFSIPTDCPQRNERLGWAGDISVFSRTATYLADVPQFLRRYLQAMRDVQREDGRFPDVAPLGVGFGGLLWGSAGITVPWEVYQQYGDKSLLAEHYSAMGRYIDYILAKTINPETDILEQEKVWGNLGDWLGPEDNKNDKTLMWEAYFLYDLDIMVKVSKLLGKESEARRYADLYRRRKDFFLRTYVDKATARTVSSGADGPEKGKPVDIQTSYVLPLAFGLVPPELREEFAARLSQTVQRENVGDDGKTYPAYSLMTGFIGTAWISKALSDNGYDDVAYKLLQQTTYPSWLYSVEQGATTIWERLNSYTHVDGFGENNRMNSFNHYSFGAVGAWMYAYSLGIMRDENYPGFKHFVLSPRVDPTGQMTFARSYYDSLYGRIESAWEVKDGEVRYSFTVPANTSATLYLPVASADKLTENGRVLQAGKEGVKEVVWQEGMLRVEVLSGTYHWVVAPAATLGQRN